MLGAKFLRATSSDEKLKSHYEPRMGGNKLLAQILLAVFKFSIVEAGLCLT